MSATTTPTNKIDYRALMTRAHAIAKANRENFPRRTYRDLFAACLRIAWRRVKEAAQGITAAVKAAAKTIATIFHFNGNNKKSRSYASWKLDKEHGELTAHERELAWKLAEQKHFDERHTTIYSTTVNDKIAQYNTYCGYRG